MQKTRNKNILITGASSGIGEALALEYAKTTAKNLFICGRNEKRLNEVARNRTWCQSPHQNHRCFEPF